MVWKDTQRVGCAVAECGSRLQRTYVCLYSPLGNINSAAKFSANVLPAGPAPQRPKSDRHKRWPSGKVLSAFNAERAEHQAPKLAWSSALQKSAKVLL